MNEAALLDALREAMKARPAGDGITATELRAALGVGVERLRVTLLRLVESGTLRCVKVSRPSIDGRLQQVPGYQMVTAAKGKR